VDDEEGFRYSFRRVFSREENEVITAATAAEGRTLFRERRPDVVVLDLQLPDGSGLDVFETILAEDSCRPVIFITAHGTASTALEAMKRGAFDYLLKPVDFERLNDILNRALEASRLMHIPAVLPALEPTEPIIGRSPALQDVCKTIGRVAPLEVNVLILGESGVGKELVARALYHHSKRADRPFLAVNCAALPEGLIESELFGHEKGAFTGAERKRIGKFEQCQDGTLFLDEIGDMPPAAQAKMLRVLQEQRFERVGGVETVQTHVRVIAATNQNLEKRIAEGKFRADLYYRLRGISIVVPPLRDRPEDIPELAHHFLFQFDREMGLHLKGFDPEALALLQQYRWPGNVRELRSVIQEAMLRCPGPLVLPEALPDALGANPQPPSSGASQGNLGPNADLGRMIDELIQRGENDLYAKVIHLVERELFSRVLRATQGHQAQASDRLGLNRTTLRYKLRDLGLNIDQIVGDV